MATLILDVDDLVVATFDPGITPGTGTDIPYSPYCCTDNNSGCDTNREAGCTDVKAGCWAVAPGAE